jgi:hypothetical protein
VSFRDPLTTADAVDTGRGPSDAGVRLYQDLTSPGVPVGVAEWRTGQMNRNATAKLAGGGSGGSSFVIDGGAPLPGYDAPQVRYNVEQQADSSYLPVLRLVANAAEGGKIIPDVVLSSPTETTWVDLGMGSTAWTAWDTTTSKPRARQGASGDVHLEGIVKLAGSPNFLAGARVPALTLPSAAYAPQKTAVDRIIPVVNAAGAYATVAWLDIPAGSTSVFLTNISGANITTAYGFLFGCTFSALP